MTKGEEKIRKRCYKRSTAAMKRRREIAQTKLKAKHQARLDPSS